MALRLSVSTAIRPQNRRLGRRVPLSSYGVGTRGGGGGPGVKPVIHHGDGFNKRFHSASDAAVEGSPPPSSSTAVIAPSPIDPASPISSALAQLAKTGFADENRTQLAIRSMEQGKQATVRVGMLGRGQNVGRLVRLVLADPTVPEENWERRIANWDGEGRRRGLIIRWGSSEHFIETLNEPVAYMTVPSPHLRDSKVSILLTNLPMDHQATVEELHTPAIVQPRSGHSGQPRIMRYAEHKTLVFNDSLAEFLQNPGTKPDETLMTAVNVPGLSTATKSGHKDSVITINLDLAEEALRKARKDGPHAAKAAQKEWNDSGVEYARSWVVAGSGIAPRMPNSEMHPIVGMTIHSILADAAEALTKYESTNGTLPPDVPTEKTLGAAISLWAELAHEELGNELEGAFASRIWNKLSWWKVLWDTSEITNTVRLVVAGGGGVGVLGKAEREGWEIFGKLRGAGFTKVPTAIIEEMKSTFNARTMDPLVAPKDGTRGVDLVHSFSFPKTISAFQNQVLDFYTTKLSSEASHLVRQVVQTSGASLVFSSTLHFAFNISVYSSFSIAALGTMVSVWSFVRKWEGLKHEFERSVREGGKAAILTGQVGAWEILEGGRRTHEDRGIEGKKAIGRVQMALRQTGAFVMERPSVPLQRSEPLESAMGSG